MYNTHQTLEIKNKLVEMHLFSGKPDTALIMINEIFLTIMPTNKFFNDLMELRDLINFYYVEVDEKSKEVFINYLKSESLLKQRKISEANQLLKYIIKQNEEQKLFPLLCLRRAIILTKLNKYNEALDLLTKLKNTIYSDRGEVMSGQIYEQIYNDKEIAMRHFMKVINEFPNSIFSEPIRYHIRKLKSDEKI
jgi:tetratricopeptide (TPR) repeat protein